MYWFDIIPQDHKAKKLTVKIKQYDPIDYFSLRFSGLIIKAVKVKAIKSEAMACAYNFWDNTQSQTPAIYTL